ncbi:MAG TPA: phosphotransferase family protein, partial [Kiloniellaceae bacterium]|nr:phosphotransferase family protein [Kiloniellaceae bacterium]
YVLRRKPPGTLLPSAHAIEREYRVMSALEPTAVPVPRMLHLCEDDSVIGTAFFVMEYLDGRSFHDPILPGLSPPERGRIYEAMAETLAALHELCPEEQGLEDFGRTGDYFARQLARWTKQYRYSQTRDLPAMEKLIAWLECERPEDDGQVSVIHGDYRVENILFDPAVPRIIGVVDWELSTLGHPFADLAYQCMRWRLPRDRDFCGLGDIDRFSHGIPTEQAYVAAYCRRRGLSGIANWTFCIAFSAFRLAAILQGVHKRALDGNASNPERGRRLGAAVPRLAAMALQEAETGQSQI